jgi:hypothetical protein
MLTFPLFPERGIVARASGGVDAAAAGWWWCSRGEEEAIGDRGEENPWCQVAEAEPDPIDGDMS